MKLVVVIVSIMVGIIAVIALVGMMMPREHRAVSRVALHQPPETVYAVLRDFERSPTWWREVRSASRLPDLDGHERWQQVTGMGVIGLIVVEERAPAEFRTTVDTSGGSPFGGEWDYRIQPTDQGSVVTITEHGWVSNPLFRCIGRLIGHHRTLDSNLAALALHFGEAAVPEHVSADGET